MKNENILWVKNPGGTDVSLSDLGVKVPAGKTVNVYAVNPYLTVEQVEKSRSSGALFKRLESKILIIVTKAVSVVPPTLNQIKESDQPIRARKTKSSVVIEPSTDEPQEEGDSFDFADYGVNGLGPIEHKRETGAVLVDTFQDQESKELAPAVNLEPISESGLSKQSQIVMKTTSENMVDPIGPLAETSVVTEKQPFAVVKPPKAKEELVVEHSAEKHIVKDETGTIVVDGKTKHRSIKQIKRAQEDGVPTEEAEEDSAINLEETKFDTKIATKTEDGAIVMKLKEEVVEK